MASWQEYTFFFVAYALLGLGILLYVRHRRHLALRPLFVYGYSSVLVFLTVFYSIPFLVSPRNEQLLFRVIAVVVAVAATSTRWFRNRMYVLDFKRTAREIDAPEHEMSKP